MNSKDGWDNFRIPAKLFYAREEDKIKENWFLYELSNAIYDELIKDKSFKNFTDQELIELSYKALNIVDIDKRELILNPTELKQLLEVYKGIVEPEDASIMVNFLKVLTTFVNNNSEALEEIEHTKLKIQLTINDIGDYVS